MEDAQAPEPVLYRQQKTENVESDIHAPALWTTTRGTEQAKAQDVDKTLEDKNSN